MVLQNAGIRMKKSMPCKLGVCTVPQKRKVIPQLCCPSSSQLTGDCSLAQQRGGLNTKLPIWCHLIQSSFSHFYSSVAPGITDEMGQSFLFWMIPGCLGGRGRNPWLLTSRSWWLGMGKYKQSQRREIRSILCLCWEIPLGLPLTAVRKTESQCTHPSSWQYLYRQHFSSEETVHLSYNCL